VCLSVLRQLGDLHVLQIEAVRPGQELVAAERERRKHHSHDRSNQRFAAGPTRPELLSRAPLKWARGSGWHRK
jgi:hypothetical protein